MAKDRSKEYQARRDKDAQDKKELERLRKRKGDFVQKHLAAGTAAGDGYETEVKKRQDAIDEFYAGTLAGSVARSRKKKKDAASAKIPELEKQITVLRDAPGHLSRKRRREIEGLEEQLEKKRKTARGVLAHNEPKAAKRRSEATKAVTKLRRDLQPLADHQLLLHAGHLGPAFLARRRARCGARPALGQDRPIQ